MMPVEIKHELNMMVWSNNTACFIEFVALILILTCTFRFLFLSVCV